MTTMHTPALRMGCLECDLLVQVDPLAPGERATCPRCNHLLTVNIEEGFTKALAFAIAAAVLLALSMSFPFLSLEASGLEKVMTLPGSAYELYLDGFVVIAFLVMVPIIGVPALMIAALAALLIPLRVGRNAPWLVPTARLLYFLNPWSMVEVFVIGVLVSLVKISALATVVLGISFWAYVAFAICFTASWSQLDRVQVWERIEAIGS